MGEASVGKRIERALEAANMSQRSLAQKTGISQPTLNRIINGSRAVKVNELVAIATATGCTIAELTGTSTVADRVEFAARATNGASVERMRDILLHYLELDAYLDDQGIGAAP